MGKSKKKKQNSDFQKVKLKVGKRKPVGTNVTDTSFKSASINVHTQMQQKLEPTNRKNLTLKELLMHLNHYNANIRQDSLSGLKDLFTKHPDIISKELNIWLSKVVEKLVDPDVLVRQSICHCLEFALNNLTESDLKPFLNVIIVHICCGMTHINEAIQLDSLCVLEILIDQFPALIYPFIPKILNNFLDLISKKSTKGSSKQKLVKGKVISNMVSRDINEGKLIPLKNQAKVFGKLLKILLLLKTYQQKKTGTNGSKRKAFMFTVKQNEPSFVLFHKIKYNDNIDLNAMDYLEKNNTQEGNNILENVDDFHQTVFQVLINSWVEHDPSILETGIVDTKRFQMLQPGMMTIIQLFDILFYLLDNATEKSKQDNIQNYTWVKDFSTYFLKYFVLPLDLSKSSRSHKGIHQNKTSKVQLLALNYNFLSAKAILFMCKNLDYYGERKSHEKFIDKYYKKLMNFLMIIISEGNSLLDMDLIKEFCSIMFQVFDIHSNLKLFVNTDQSSIDSGVILDGVVEIFAKASLVSPWKIPLIHFFTRLVNKNQYESFMQQDVRLRLEKFSTNIISNIWSMPCTSSALIENSLDYIKMVLLRNMLTKKQKIVLESSLIKMTELKNGFSFCELPIATQRSLLDILFYLDSFSEQLVKNICKICQHVNVSKQTKQSCVSLLSCSATKEDSTITPELFVSFVLSLSMGYTVKELQDMNTSYENLISWSMLNIFEDTEKDVPVEFAIEHLRHFHGPLNNMWTIIVPSIGKLLVMFRILPITTAKGLIKILNSVSSWQSDFQDDNTNINSEINQVVDLTLASLLFGVSSTYKQLVRKELKNEEEHSDEIVSLCNCLLINNAPILKQLVTKSINTLNEYKMNKDCVNSIIEVLLSLLQDEELRLKMVPFKTELENITKLASNQSSPADQQYLRRQLELQISLL